MELIKEFADLITLIVVAGGLFWRIGRIEARLDSGSSRFDRHEERDNRLEGKIDKLIERELDKADAEKGT